VSKVTVQLFESTRVRIEAPTAPAAFELERRLVFHKPTAIEKYGRWFVEFEEFPEHLDEIVVAVKHWLADEQIDETVIHSDGRARHIRAPR